MSKTSVTAQRSPTARQPASRQRPTPVSPRGSAVGATSRSPSTQDTRPAGHRPQHQPDRRRCANRHLQRSPHFLHGRPAGLIHLHRNRPVTVFRPGDQHLRERGRAGLQLRPRLARLPCSGEGQRRQPGSGHDVVQRRRNRSVLVQPHRRVRQIIEQISSSDGKTESGSRRSRHSRLQHRRNHRAEALRETEGGRHHRLQGGRRCPRQAWLADHRPGDDARHRLPASSQREYRRISGGS